MDVLARPWLPPLPCTFVVASAAAGVPSEVGDVLQRVPDHTPPEQEQPLPPPRGHKCHPPVGEGGTWSVVHVVRLYRFRQRLEHPGRRLRGQRIVACAVNFAIAVAFAVAAV